jgi:hypothetical protein
MSLQKFQETYAKNLKKVRLDKDSYYQWPLSELEVVTARMLEAIEKGNFNKDSLAFKWTCKELGIKHTYKAIREYCKS